MDGAKLASLGWTNRVAFADGLAATIDWFRANEAWWRAARSGEWDAYYDRQYAGRLASANAVAEVSAGAQAAAGAEAVPADVAPGGQPAETEA
jgi:dTDP-glucose 4,6-dehydratase